MGLLFVRVVVAIGGGMATAIGIWHILQFVSLGGWIEQTPSEGMVLSAVASLLTMALAFKSAGVVAYLLRRTMILALLLVLGPAIASQFGWSLVAVQVVATAVTVLSPAMGVGLSWPEC